MYSHLRLAGIAVVKLRVDILHLIVLLLPGNCKTRRKQEAIRYKSVHIDYKVKYTYLFFLINLISQLEVVLYYELQYFCLKKVLFLYNFFTNRSFMLVF